MINNDLLTLLKDLKKVAREQYQALTDEDIGTLIALQQQRMMIIKKIEEYKISQIESNRSTEVKENNISNDKEKYVYDEEKFSQSGIALIEEVIKIDEKIRLMIKNNINSLVDSIMMIEKVKRIFKNKHVKPAKTIHINI